MELARKATHMGALVIPIGYLVLGLSRQTAFLTMMPIALTMLLIDISRLRNWAFWRAIGRPLISPIIRHHEHNGDFTGATYILLSACFSIGLFAKPIAIAAIAYIIVGDSFAAVIGRRYGRHKFGRKSIEGSLGCLIGTLLVASLGSLYGLTLGFAVAGAFVATIIEAISTKIDDNVTVPLASGLVLTILTKIC
jgi:dolichol kinase